MVKLNENEQNIHDLIEALGKKREPLVQKEALESLVKLRATAVDALITALKDTRWSVRERAAVALEGYSMLEQWMHLFVF
jgi:HEAT repeat protein